MDTSLILELFKGLRDDIHGLREDLTKLLEKHDTRIEKLESSRTWLLGAWWAIGAITGLVIGAVHLIK